MPKEINENYKQPEYDDVIQELPDDETFEIGQNYKKVAATTLSCKRCGNTAFMVGKGSYYTAVKCSACDWQLCIHDG